MTPAILTVPQQTMGMCELYDMGIVHCDLKPGNILVSNEGHLAIADFGISLTLANTADAGKPFDECKFNMPAGTYPYQAPEMLLSETLFTCAVDVWSFGVIIFEMYTNGVCLVSCYLLVPGSSTLKTPALYLTRHVFSRSSPVLRMKLRNRFAHGIYRQQSARILTMSSRRIW
jgi:serine/threonine protein kinase